MTVSRPFAEQNIRPLPVQDTLPTMYDLPSEDPEEPGLPDEFHDLQPQLLSQTLRLTNVARDRIFTGTDLNLYYDANHTLWHKRPDWFLAIGVPRLYDGWDLRLSYVIWQEGVSPTVVVELLSPGTEKEDLGQTESGAGEPPTKWMVYEQILKVPYYILYDRYTNKLRGFRLSNGQYKAIPVKNEQIEISALKLRLGLWQGEYDGILRKWLRWMDAEGNWIPTDYEVAEQNRAAAEQGQRVAEEKAERLAERLRSLGIDPDEI
jgi:Uma2 family endonuclease